MSRSSPFNIVLSDGDRHVLEGVVRRGRSEQRAVVRARIVLLAAVGVSNVGIAEMVGVHVDTVSKWRKRFFGEGVAGLVDRPRSGRPRVFGPLVRAEVIQLACELPALSGVPLARWSSAELADELIASSVVDAISRSTVSRVLARAAIRPWQHRSWIFPRDPHFADKAGVVLDLYARSFAGEALSDDEFVISADEKTSIQARCRCHPSLPPGRSRLMRVEHEYDRHGALAYLVAYDAGRAQVMGCCADTPGIVPFGRLVDKVMTTEP